MRIRSGRETVRIRDPGWKKVGSGIRDKHPGSATLYIFIISVGGFVNWHCWSVFSLCGFGLVPLCPSEHISEQGFLNPVLVDLLYLPDQYTVFRVRCQFFTQTNPDPGIRTLDYGSGSESGSGSDSDPDAALFDSCFYYCKFFLLSTVLTCHKTV